MEMTQEFVPFEQALKLKQIGFDEPCLSIYDKDSVLNRSLLEYPIINSKNGFHEHWNIITAPLYQQAFRWFREKLGLHGVYTMGDDWNNYYWQIWKNDCMTKTFVCSSDYVFETYEAAELACLDKLIKIVESKSEQK